MPIEDVAEDYKECIDVNCSGAIEAADAAVIMQKVLKSSYTMPIEEKYAK